jgi:quercetin dioxygenase-like cupin family protein
MYLQGEEIFIRPNVLQMLVIMDEDVVFIKGDDEVNVTKKPGKLYRLMIKSHKMEAIIAEIDPHTESKRFQHEGEEMHLVLEGEMEYTVGEKTYKLSVGDILWHKSMLVHQAKNTKSKKVVYITIGTPPSFMSSMV